MSQCYASTAGGSPTGSTPRANATGLAAFLPATFLAAKGTSGLDVYGWLGTLAVYGLVVSEGAGVLCSSGLSARSPRHRKCRDEDHPMLAFAAMVFALVANLYPVSEGADGQLPYNYLAYLVVALLLSVFRARGKTAVHEGS